MRIGETLKKAAGLFVELPEDDPDAAFNAAMRAPLKGVPDPAPVETPRPVTKTVEQIVRESPGPNLDEIKVPVTTPQQVVEPDGKVDFKAIYQMASLTPSAFSAEQVLDIMASMPADLPLETKRATIKITLNAMTQTLGVSPETIVADASRKLAALAAYAESHAKQAGEFVAKTDVEIANLEAEIEKRKKAIEEAKAQQTIVAQACTAESDRLDDVLEFFSLDVAPSKYAPEAKPAT